ncbi:MAG: heme A synthase [Chloroflexi bacterium]|nr:MAG: heme A synthase [Chloroflexota bacterium]
MTHMTKFQRLAATTVVATLILIAIGSIVRTTGSGLGCPDWPLCHGQWHPPFERTAIIEYSHRTAASIVGALVVATAAVALLRHRYDRALVWLAVLSLALLGFQAWLGKVTVERELPPMVVLVHLANALILLAVLTKLAVLARLGAGREPIATPERASMLRILFGCTAAMYVVLLSGAYVVGSGATTACVTWPGCAQAPIPFIDGGAIEHIHWLHRFAVLGGAAAAGAGALAVLWSRDAGPQLRRAAQALLWLYGVQVLSGALNIWTMFSATARVLHLVVGSTIWALLIVMAVAARYRAAPVGQSSPAPAGRDGAARDRAAV